jgi:hypothetical protein
MNTDFRLLGPCRDLGGDILLMVEDIDGAASSIMW